MLTLAQESNFSFTLYLTYSQSVSTNFNKGNRNIFVIKVRKMIFWRRYHVRAMEEVKIFWKFNLQVTCNSRMKFIEINLILSFLAMNTENILSSLHNFIVDSFSSSFNFSNDTSQILLSFASFSLKFSSSFPSLSNLLLLCSRNQSLFLYFFPQASQTSSPAAS